MSDKKIFGIDLGTTYSCISYIDEHERIVVVPNSEGQLTTPSVVFFETPDNIVVGSAAKEVAAIEPQKVVSTVKRMMGDPDWTFHAYGRDYTPQEVSAFILRKLVAEAHQQTGIEIEDVVITVPAYFGTNEKEATKQAGELAGLNVRYVIPEPTAAALAYGLKAEDAQTVLVYDLGGGTFDITVIRLEPGDTRVICTGGDHKLGGRNWDEAIVAHFMEIIEQETGASPETQSDDEELYQELLGLAEDAKLRLSTKESWRGRSAFDGQKITLPLSRETFDRLTRDLLDKTLSMTDLLIADARERGFGQIDKMLLVGGSTYMPQVTEALEARYDYALVSTEPNYAVAKGAAHFGFKCDIDDSLLQIIARETGESADEIDVQAVDAAIVEEAQREVAREFGLAPGKVKELVDHVVRNVTSKSFGLVVRLDDDTDGVANLISKNDQVPATITRKFVTHADNQESVEIRLMENQATVGPDETVPVPQCAELCSGTLPFERPLPIHSPIEVRFVLAPDGLLQVHALDLTTGREIDVEHQTKGVLTKEQQAVARSHSLAMTVN